MNPRPNGSSRKFRRLPGEVAFDRCFFPVAVMFCSGVIFNIIALAHRNRLKDANIRGDGLHPADVGAPHAWWLWFYFTLGVVLAVLWVRAFLTLIRDWRDPSARVLRFPAAVLLFPFAGTALIFLRLIF